MPIRLCPMLRLSSIRESFCSHIFNHLTITDIHCLFPLSFLLFTCLPTPRVLVPIEHFICPLFSDWAAVFLSRVDKSTRRSHIWCCLSSGFSSIQLHLGGIICGVFEFSFIVLSKWLGKSCNLLILKFYIIQLWYRVIPEYLVGPSWYLGNCSL